MRTTILFCIATLTATLMWNPSQAQNYCSPNVGYVRVEPITSVVYAGINNTTDPTIDGSPGLEDFTDIFANVTMGDSDIITLKGNTNGANTSRFTVFIDWNQNGILNDPGEVYVIGFIYGSTGTDNKSVSKLIEVPLSALTGDTRMRVIKNFYESPLDPCGGYYAAGQAEDYTVHVSPPPTCPTPTNLTVDAVTKTTADVSWTTGGNETSWNISWGPSGYTPGDGNEIDTAIANNTNFQLTDLTAGTTYFIYVQADCGNDDLSTWEGPLEIFTGYCKPSTTGNDSHIQSFTAIGNAELDISNLDSGYGLDGNGYSDFSAQTVEVSAGGTIDYTVTIEDGETAGLRIWVDWNQDMVFDEVNEKVYQSSSYNESYSGSLTTPIDASGSYRMRIGSSYVPHTGPINACAHNQNGEYEDYTINIVTVSCPKPNSLTLNAINQTTVDFSWIAGATETSWNISWGTSGYTPGDGNEIDTAIANTTSYQITGLAPNAMYDIYVQGDCGGNDLSAWAGPLEVYVGYCRPFTTGNNGYIRNFTAEGHAGQDISNLDSGYGLDGNGYSDFSTQTVEVSAGGEIYYTVSIESGQTAGLKIWIDWNNDLEFDETNELVYQSSDYDDSFTGTFAIPLDALGNYRMRIGSSHVPQTGPINACAHNKNGEYEDYTIVVGTLDSCTGTPDAGTAFVDPTSGNPGSNYTVSSQGYIFSSEMSFQWQSNTNGQGWQDEGTATESYSSYIATAPNELGKVVAWRLALTCNVSAETAFSDEAIFTTAITYCVPSITEFVEPITRVVFAGIDNPSSALSVIEYEDFTSIMGLVEAGGTYDFAVEGFTDGPFTNFFTVWIDWNQNGDLEASEMYEIGYITNSDGTDGQQAISDIVVPENALSGETRMRVIKNYDSSPTDPCGSYEYGQIEDYTVKVSTLGCTSPELTLAAQDAYGAPIVDCIDAGGEYYVLATVSGGSGNSSYNLTANDGDPVIVNADSSVVLGPFAAGTDVLVIANGNDDDSCGASANIDSPTVCPPSNDECANAIALSCGDSVEGTTVNATYSGLTDSCTFSETGDVFYTFDVEEGNEYTISVVGADYDAVLAIYSGPCGNLTELACTDDSSGAGTTETITFTAATTETIVIRTYDQSVSAGSFTISVSWDTTPYPSTDYFITTWKTDNIGTSNNTSITIPTFLGETYLYDVDWNNDGTFDDLGVTGTIIHDYGAVGTYTVAIRGNFPRIYFNNEGDKRKILSIDQWGTNAWSSMNAAFHGCLNLEGNPTDSPNLSLVTDMSYMFTNAYVFNGEIGDWDVTNVTNMNNMFNGALVFNQDIGNWNVGNVTDMSLMFPFAYEFNQDIGNWNVANVTDMSHMFFNAWAFNRDIGNWDVGNVTNMEWMFKGASAFNQEIGGWDVANVTNMKWMFNESSAFNGNIGPWNVGNVTDMSFMFRSASAFNQDIGSWNVGSVTTMSEMFRNALVFNQDIGTWNVGNVTDMRNMFEHAFVFNQDIGTWNVGNVTNMEWMFTDASAFNQNIGNWNVGNVTNMIFMFRGVTLSTANYDALLNGWNTQVLKNNVDFHGGNSQYCNGEAARANIISTFGWTITDGGLDAACIIVNAPIAVCQPVTVNADTNCQGNATAQDFDGGSTDPQGLPLTFTVDP
ncbi:MAG: BspA family leucine-rich repeat surface protein, partial [Aequorivita sp.]